MALSYINGTKSRTASGTSVSGIAPTGLQEGDIMFALIFGENSYCGTPPAGWTKIAELFPGNIHRYQIFYHIATSSDIAEVTTYSWAGFTTGKILLTTHAFRGGFDDINPIYDFSNSAYTTTNTTLRAASIDNPISNNPCLFFGCVYSTSVKTCTAPTGWTECWDLGDTTGDSRHFVYLNNSLSSGETGNIDATISASLAEKHAFAVALNPATTGNPGAFFQMF